MPGKLADDLPGDLIAWVAEGKPHRFTDRDLLAGRCGAGTSHSGSTYCRRPAGWGTDHKRVGRCRDHEDSQDGLPPWVGVIPDDQWRYISGGKLEVRETHGATVPGLLPIEQVLLNYLDESDQEAYLAATTDPHQLIDVELKMRQLAQVKVHRAIQRERLLSRGVETQNTLAMEGLLEKITTGIARLLEVKKGFAELAQGQERHQTIKELLRSLTPDEYAEVKANPHLIAGFIGRDLGAA